MKKGTKVKSNTTKRSVQYAFQKVDKYQANILNNKKRHIGTFNFKLIITV